MLIKVTADDIREGTRNSCAHCPIARAAIRATGDPGVMVGPNTMWSTSTIYGVGWEGVALPPIARAFIQAFDNDEGVIPISFEIDWPERAAA